MRASFGFAIVAGAFPLFLLWKGRLGRYLGFAISGGSAGGNAGGAVPGAAPVGTQTNPGLSIP